MTATYEVPPPRTATVEELRRVVIQLNAQIAALERRIAALERAAES